MVAIVLRVRLRSCSEKSSRANPIVLAKVLSKIARAISNCSSDTPRKFASSYVSSLNSKWQASAKVAPAALFPALFNLALFSPSNVEKQGKRDESI
jgi:hypothetical protein